MTIVFLDECGHTGPDLLNKDQPFFVLSSLTLPEQECSNLKREFFSKVQASELKHRDLAKSKSHQQAILSFIRAIKEKQDILKITVNHKRYSLTCKLVDMVIEPYLFENGFNLYEKGMNIATANIFHQVIPILSSESFLDDLLIRFQQMIRYRTKESYESFFYLVFQEHENYEVNRMLDLLRQAYYYLGHRIYSNLPENALDIAFSHAMLLMATWRKEISDTIDLIHDESSNMSKQRYIWDALMSPDLPDTIVGYDRRKMKFPIAINKTSFESSKDWAGLQLADVLAGAFARAANWHFYTQDPNDTYGRELLGLIADVPVLPVLPGTAFTPEGLGTTGENAVDPNEYVAKILRRLNNKPNS